MDDQELYKETIKFWGDDKQLRMVQEECAELIVAVSHYLREKNNKNFENLAEEMADVYIMLQQGMMIVGSEPIKRFTEFKIKRVREKLKICKEKIDGDTRD